MTLLRFYRILNETIGLESRWEKNGRITQQFGEQEQGAKESGGGKVQGGLIRGDGWRFGGEKAKGYGQRRQRKMVKDEVEDMENGE